MMTINKLNVNNVGIGAKHVIHITRVYNVLEIDREISAHVLMVTLITIRRIVRGVIIIVLNVMFWVNALNASIIEFPLFACAHKVTLIKMANVDSV